MSMLPTLLTRRLVLRAFDPTVDAAAVLAIGSDPLVARFLNDSAPLTPADVEAFFDRHLVQYPDGRGFAALIDHARGELAGWAGLQVPRRWMARVIDNPLPEGTFEIGWTLAPGYRRRGYATEAADAWLGYGFDTLGLDEIIAVRDPDNVASGRVMERLGMVRSGTVRLSGDETLCLYVLGREAWVSAARERRGCCGTIVGAAPDPRHRTSETSAESGATS